MKKLILLFILTLSAVSVFAQTHTTVTVEDNQTITATKSFTKPVVLSPTTVSGLPSASTVKGGIATITDGTSLLDCTVGGGSTVVFCTSNGSVWSTIRRSSFDESGTGLSDPTADATFTYPVASTSGLTIAGTAPASVSTTPGTAATTLFNVSGVIGGASTNASGTGGVGSSPAIVAGAGGAATGATSSTGGAGGSINLTTGAGGASGGTGDNGDGGNLNITLGIAGTGGSGPAGEAGVVAVTGPTAGLTYITQGTAVTALNTNFPANSIVDYAPTSVTAYQNARPGVAPVVASYRQTDACPSALCTESFHPVPAVLTVASDFTDSTSTTLKLVTGLSLTMPVSQAVVMTFHCSLLFDQATTAVVDEIGIGVTGTAPTSANAGASAHTSTTVTTTGTLVSLASTTPTAVVTFTPSAITTIWKAELDGAVEQPSNATPGVFGVYVYTTTGADNLIVKRGSFCRAVYQ
jgi:hypothetical protein